MPLLTPAELWKTSGRYRDPGAVQAQGPPGPRVRAADDARGDGHVPRSRDPELPAAAEDPLPPVGQGPRRAAPARRADPGARVHHEGRLLVRPRRRRPRGELPQALRARTSASSSAAGSRRSRSPPSPGSWAAAAARTSSRRPARARTRSSSARTATTRPTSRSPGGVPSAADFPEELEAPEEVETPGHRTIEAVSEYLGVDPARDREGDAGRRRRRARARTRPRRRPAQRDEAARRARRELPAGGGRGDPGSIRRRAAARSGRSARTVELIADEALARRPVRGRRQPRRRPPARRPGRTRLRGPLRRFARSSRRRRMSSLRRASTSTGGDRSGAHLQAGDAVLGAARRPRSSTRTGPSGR